MPPEGSEHAGGVRGPELRQLELQGGHQAELRRAAELVQRPQWAEWRPRVIEKLLPYIDRKLRRAKRRETFGDSLIDDMLSAAWDELRRAAEAQAKAQAELRQAQQVYANQAQAAPAPGSIPELPEVHPIHTALAEAAWFVSQHSGIPSQSIVRSGVARREALRLAALKLHPDQGGSNEDMVRLNRHRQVLNVLDVIE